jgi:hypothetical protein
MMASAETPSSKVTWGNQNPEAVVGVPVQAGHGHRSTFLRTSTPIFTGRLECKHCDSSLRPLKGVDAAVLILFQNAATLSLKKCEER